MACTVGTQQVLYKCFWAPLLSLAQSSKGADAKTVCVLNCCLNTIGVSHVIVVTIVTAQLQLSLSKALLMGLNVRVFAGWLGNVSIL